MVELEVDEVALSLRYTAVNRTQRSAAQGGAVAGGFSNQGAAQSFPQDDPWATPQTTAGAGGWGNGPDSEPPF
ncbi:hypothetical protein [Arthrobacter sp. MMS18-M83]|uniref:hypothetical protein n=1 Tax=Arthrobacter sp. MMS18-M83 TaxID=2996261 RepID=UPI002DD432D6|nr:hypothetical protein [Arthrobacter sp. MMS18-M83]